MKRAVVGVLVVVALGAGLWAWGAARTDREAESRARTQAEISRAAASIVALRPPAGFEAVECEDPTSASDRCWRAVGAPRELLADLASAFGVDATTDCQGSPSLDGEPAGCSAQAGVLLLSAIRDPGVAGAGTEPLADTCTVHAWTNQLGD